MPKETFFNLEEHKKKTIIDAAKKEFTENELHKARVSNIIKEAAEELRSLYETGKLNFPTILVNEKKLRNPTDKELIKWTQN